MTKTTTLNPYALVLLRANTEDAIAAYPHLATLRDRACEGSVQALTALIHACDALALPTWHTTDRAYVVAIRDEMRTP